MYVEDLSASRIFFAYSMSVAIPRLLTSLSCMTLCTCIAACVRLYNSIILCVVLLLVVKFGDIFA